MSKVAIVGVEGSGKTVLMAALCECYKRISETEPFLFPENQAAYMFMERIPHKLRVERQWPEATSIDSLRMMKWTLKCGGEILSQIEMLDYPGELYRLAFGEHTQEEADAHRKELDEFLGHLTDAECLIILMNPGDLENIGADVKKAETVWITREMLGFAKKLPSLRRTTLVFTQADRYTEALKNAGVAEGFYAQKLPMLKHLYPELRLSVVSAVSGLDEVGRPKEGYSAEGCLEIMREVLWQRDAEIKNLLQACKKELDAVKGFAVGDVRAFSALTQKYAGSVKALENACKPLKQLYVDEIKCHQKNEAYFSQFTESIYGVIKGIRGAELAQQATWATMLNKHEPYSRVINAFRADYEERVARNERERLDEEARREGERAAEAKRLEMERQREELRRKKKKKQAIAGAVVAVLAIMAGVTGSCAVERDRTQRVSVLWAEALRAKENGNWQGVLAATQWVLALRPGNPTVLALKREAMEKAETVDIGGGVKLEMVWCPAGSFLMGSPESEAGRSKDETQHQVTLTKGFWLGRTEVTQRQWDAVMGSSPSHFKGADLPVKSVSWDDCQDFVRKLNEKNARGRFRLPTEAEWEYACRAGTTGPYAGSLGDMGWYDGNSGQTAYEAGQKRANAWGLYDMHGNVCEWCQDWYDGDYPAGNATDPAGSGSGSSRVFRGGSWCYAASRCRSACRGWDGPSYTGYYIGLRVVLAPVP